MNPGLIIKSWWPWELRHSCCNTEAHQWAWTSNTHFIKNIIQKRHTHNGTTTWKLLLHILLIQCLLIIKPSLWKCCSGYNHIPKFWLAWKFKSLPQILRLIILDSLLVSWWFQAPILDLKGCPCSHLHAACVIFGYRGCCFSCKGNVVLLQGNCVRMSGCHHIDMLYSHLMHSFHEGCCIKKSMSYVFLMVYVASLTVCGRSQSSPITVYICFNDLTLIHFPKQPSFIQLPRTMCHASTTIKIHPLPVETLQCAKTPTSLSYWNPTACRDPR